jgi:hypothetical protein
VAAAYALTNTLRSFYTFTPTDSISIYLEFNTTNLVLSAAINCQDTLIQDLIVYKPTKEYLEFGFGPYYYNITLQKIKEDIISYLDSYHFTIDNYLKAWTA